MLQASQVVLSAQKPVIVTKTKPAKEYPAVDDLVKFITGEDVTGSETPKLDKKQRKKLKKVQMWSDSLTQIATKPVTHLYYAYVLYRCIYIIYYIYKYMWITCWW